MFLGRAFPSVSVAAVHHMAPVWAILVPGWLLLCSVVFAIWVIRRLSRGWRLGGDDFGEGGGGGRGPRRPDPPEPAPDGEPEWWDRFEQEFAAYAERSRPAVKTLV